MDVGAYVRLGGRGPESFMLQGVRSLSRPHRAVFDIAVHVMRGLPILILLAVHWIGYFFRVIQTEFGSEW